MRSKSGSKMKSMMKKAARKSNLLMEIAEDMMDIVMKAKKYKRLNKKK